MSGIKIHDTKVTNNFCKDHLDKQQRGKAESWGESWCRSVSAVWNKNQN